MLASACSSRVDLPMPGSPPISTTPPATRPPPSTRSNSSMPVPKRGTSIASMSASDSTGAVCARLLWTGFDRRLTPGASTTRLDQRVPLLAGRALAVPLVADAAAVAAGVIGFCFCHGASGPSLRSRSTRTIVTMSLADLPCHGPRPPAPAAPARTSTRSRWCRPRCATSSIGRPSPHSITLLPTPRVRRSASGRPSSCPSTRARPACVRTPSTSTGVPCGAWRG